MPDWVKNFRDNCFNLLTLTEEGNFDNVKFDDICKVIYNPLILQQIYQSGFHLIHISPDLLKKPNSHYALDSFLGVVGFYDWHKTPLEEGAEFSPINHLLKEIENMYPEKKSVLDTIYRKNAYLNTLQMEIEYISERYVWTEKPEFKEIFLAKFENLATSLVELIITCINLYERTVLGMTDSKVENFSHILPFLRDCTNKLPSEYHQCINDSIDLSFYIYIRNSLVHNFSEIEYNDSEQNPILKINDVPSDRRYGLFNDYIKEEFTKYSGRKTPRSFQEYRDPRFSYILFQFWLTRKCTLGLEESKIGFEMNIIDLTKKMLTYLFILQKDLFKTIVNPNINDT